MKLTVIGSSSSGNTYALMSEEETLILEGGCIVSTFKKVLGFDYPPVTAVLVTHSHGDHAKHVRQYARLGAFVAGNADVINKYGDKDFDQVMEEGKTYRIGGFSVTPFGVYHDVPTFGYLIRHKEMGSLLFATDTYALPYTFKNVDHWLIEANYSDDILNENVVNGTLDSHQRDRIMVSHMSLDNCIMNLKAGRAENSKNIILVHLSSRNSNEKIFRDKIEAIFGVPCSVARRGLTVTLNKDEI